MSQAQAIRELAVEELNTLPPFPMVFYKILDITENVHGSREELLRTLEMDQAIVAKVLQLANSAYYGLQRKVSTIDRAVALIGENAVREIAIYCASFGLLQRPLARYHLSARQFWEHSVTTSRVARCIASRKIPQIQEKALVAGLLHDIGKLAMNGLIDLNIDGEIQHRLESGQSLDQIERDILGIDHCEVGRLFADKWSFPIEICESIAFHHQPQSAEGHPHLVYLVHISDKISHVLAAGINLKDFLDSQANVPEWAAAIGALDLSQNEAGPILSDVESEMKKTDSFLGM